MFDSKHGMIREICPKTGNEIPLKKLPRKLNVRHWFFYNKGTADKPLRKVMQKYKEDGFNSLDRHEINTAYWGVKRECKKKYYLQTLLR
jgi:hypothetical protein